MNTSLIQDYLLYSVLINYGILIVWFVTFRFGHDRLFSLHSRWFHLSEAHFDALHYGGMTVYKIGIVLLNLVPFIALHIVSASHQAQLL